MATSSKDPRVVLVAKVILRFNWGNYGLDEVGEIRKQEAEYAWDLAEKIVAAQSRELPR